MHPGTHTAPTSLCFVTRQKRQPLLTLQSLVAPRKPGHTSLRSDRRRLGTLQRVVTLIKEIRLPVHTPSTSPCVVTQQRSVTLRLTVQPYRHEKHKRFVALQRLAALRKEMHTVRASPRLAVATFRRTQISCSPSHVIDDRAQEPAPS